VAAQAAAYENWLNIQNNRPEAVEWRKRNAMLREAWDNGFTGSHEDLFDGE
jgi:hypothetical protein